MHQLERLVLCNWGRLQPQDIAVRGMTAVLGPTGAGKSTLIDAIQLIVTGSNSRYYDLNKSTGGRNSRSIRDYCLGADDHVDPDAPARASADYRLNEALKPIHTLAEAIAGNPRRGLALLEDDTLDPKVRAGFRDLERRLSDDELVKELRDYRQFFDFDLHMRNERGQETTLSKRSVTGSGGQKQAPYYVAVGAAMASAYYPKSTTDEPDGFGLVVFDEAFNNLDAPNTRALLTFFRDMHLQVLVAAPDKVRAMFLENADTIVSVNRRPDNQEPIVVVTHPSTRAREALAAINPVNLGIDHFREPEQAAAE